jgi:low affinity Fe/Cu permease
MSPTGCWPADGTAFAADRWHGEMMQKLDHFFTRISTWIADAAGQPAAFALALGTIIVWAITGPVFAFSETWQLIINTGTTIVTFLMVFLIQNSQNRDTASMQAKLDELLYALEGAREKFIGIEHMTASEVEAVRKELEKEVADDKATALDASLKHLADRL